MLDKIVFILEFEIRKFDYKRIKLLEFWRMYLKWCNTFNEELEKSFKEKYNETFL